MDYKYINQLLERYWECQTTLEEERILRAFFSQDDIPASLLPYRDLFLYEATEPQRDVLDEQFDAKILARIGGTTPVKARVFSIRQRMAPLFKAVAVVAIVLTLGNAIQKSLTNTTSYDSVPGYGTTTVQGSDVARRDSIATDSLRRSSLVPHHDRQTSEGVLVQ